MSSLDNKRAVRFKLCFKPPYDWQTIIRFYGSHLIPGVECVTEYGFERVFRLGRTAGFVQVRPRVKQSRLEVKVVTENPKILPEIARRVRKMFDLDADPALEIAGRMGCV